MHWRTRGLGPSLHVCALADDSGNQQVEWEQPGDVGAMQHLESPRIRAPMPAARSTCPGRDCAGWVPGSALVTVAGRLDAPRTVGAGGGRVRSVRWRAQPVAWAEFDVRAGGVEHGVAVDAILVFLVAVLVPAVGVAGGVASSMRV
jgi:hypothetical protein